MARTANRQSSETITVSVTPMVRTYLEVLTDQGLYGKNIAETASDLIRLQIRALVEREQVPTLPAATTAGPNT